MTKQNHKTGFLVAVMVFCAIILRVLGKFDILIVPGGIVRSLIYVALYIGWGISVSKRIIQVQVRHYLIAVSCLLVFWFVIRTTNYFFVADVETKRYLWYFANAAYPAVFFVCSHLAGQARERKVIENGSAVAIYSYGALSAAGAYQ